MDFRTDPVVLLFPFFFFSEKDGTIWWRIKNFLMRLESFCLKDPAIPKTVRIVNHNGDSTQSATATVPNLLWRRVWGHFFEGRQEISTYSQNCFRSRDCFAIFPCDFFKRCLTEMPWCTQAQTLLALFSTLLLCSDHLTENGPLGQAFSALSTNYSSEAPPPRLAMQTPRPKRLTKSGFLSSKMQHFQARSPL